MVYIWKQINKYLVWQNIQEALNQDNLAQQGLKNNYITLF